MNDKMSQRIKNLGIIMTCIVVFHHCNYIDESLARNTLDLKLSRGIQNLFSGNIGFAMSYFFAVTGFLLFYRLNSENVYKKIKKRFFTLFIPYCAWQIIFYAAYLCVGKKIGLTEFILNTFSFWRFSTDPALWYLYIVFLFALLSPLMLKMLSNRNAGKAGIIIILIITFIVPHFADLSTGYVGSILGYIPAYLFGSYYGYRCQEEDKKDTIQFLFFLLIISAFLNGIVDDIFGFMARSMSPLLLLNFWPVKEIHRNRFVYKISFLIYAIHQPFYGFLNVFMFSAAMKLTGYIFVANIAVKIVFFMLLYLLVSVFYIVMSKFAPKILGVLTGGRI